MSHFSGSYPVNDVVFLLKPMRIQNTPVQLKEKLIQSGQKHYSELLTQESLPADTYVQMFHEAMALNERRLAQDLWRLAEGIVATRPQGIALVSLLRAGTPIGVLLKHILKRYFNIEAAHYSISILRDIGLDESALRHILQRHSHESLVFVDGWTGKGVIAGQLQTSLRDFSTRFAIEIPAELYVVTDLSGNAAFSATTEDYLIPSCLLNATVSGLVSRSIYTAKGADSDDFHGCVYYEHFREHDLSLYFINRMLQQIETLWQQQQLSQNTNIFQPEHQATKQQFLHAMIAKYDVKHTNYIKPGIGEATRVLLRRQPRLLILQSAQAAATQHLRWLAVSQGIPVKIMPQSPYQAVALINEVNL